jgi:hypothetical protein
VTSPHAWLSRLVPATDLLGYPLQDVAGLAVEKSIPGLVPEPLNHGQEGSRLPAFLTVRRIGRGLRYFRHRQLPLPLFLWGWCSHPRCGQFAERFALPEPEDL